MEILYLLILMLTVIVLAYKRVPLLVAMAIMVGLTVFWTELRHLIYVPGWFRFANGIVAVVLIGFSIKPSRRLLISDRLYGWFRKSLPRMSTTEQEALDAGTVWWDAEIFSGRPRWKKLLKTPSPQLSEREQKFLDGPVEELCRMLDNWEICNKHKKLPDNIWAFIREHRMLGMIIPEQYGGLEFSAQANSAVVMKLASRNLTAAITVMVPNSLGRVNCYCITAPNNKKTTTCRAWRVEKKFPVSHSHLLQQVPMQRAWKMSASSVKASTRAGKCWDCG